jgi:serine/threonine-protein kinase
MSTPLPQLPIGQVIGSRYRIQSLIGRGGMGMVYAATHELTGRRVALKLVVPDSEESPLLKERFLSEARIAAAVVHPNIVDVLDMGLHSGVLFLVMELLEGISLERLLEAQTRLSPEQTFGWMFPILGALATLHDAGIVHRDVKPSNIFLSSLPRHPVRPKLLDFGLARVVSDLRLTRSGTVIGTPLYMAPEHAAGHVTGPQSDVWSVGVVLFECLAGTSPFSYTDRSSLAAQVLAGAVRSLTEVRPELPPVLAMVVGRALHRDLGRRYADMRAFAHALYAAGLSSGIPMPRDPDPIGLPDYASWEQSAGGVATTLEQQSMAAGAPTSSAARAFAASGAREQGQAASTTSKTFAADLGRTKRPWRIATLLALLLLTGFMAYAWWPRAQKTPEPAAIVPTPPASVPPLPTPDPVAPITTPVVPPAAQVAPEKPPVESPQRAGKAAMQGAAAREPVAPRRRTGERSKSPKAPPVEEKTRRQNVDEVESEWK